MNTHYNLFKFLKEELMKEIESLFLKLIENFKMTDPPKEEKLFIREEVSKLHFR